MAELHFLEEVMFTHRSLKTRPGAFNRLWCADMSGFLYLIGTQAICAIDSGLEDNFDIRTASCVT